MTCHSSVSTGVFNVLFTHTLSYKRLTKNVEHCYDESTSNVAATKNKHLTVAGNTRDHSVLCVSTKLVVITQPCIVITNQSISRSIGVAHLTITSI